MVLNLICLNLSNYNKNYEFLHKTTYARQNNVHSNMLWYVRLVPGTVYSVMQSYANSFLGDVVLDTFKKVSRDADNILDQIYIKQTCSDFYYEDLKF